MSKVGLHDGDKFAVLVFYKGRPLAEITGEVFSPTELATNVYTENNVDLITAQEICQAAVSTLDFHVHKPRLKELIRGRIEELRELSEEAEGNDPPAPTTDDIPF